MVYIGYVPCETGRIRVRQKPVVVRWEVFAVLAVATFVCLTVTAIRLLFQIEPIAEWWYATMVSALAALVLLIWNIVWHVRHWIKRKSE